MLESLEPRTLFAAADLDPAFSGDGKATIGLIGSGHDWATAVSPLPDGRLLVGGRGGDDRRAVFARFLHDGQLDPAFGQGGRVSLTLDLSYSTLTSMAAFTDGSFLAAVKVGYPAQPDPSSPA